MGQENINKLFTPALVVEDLTAAKTLDKYDSGKYFTFSTSSAAYAVTLPAISDVEAGSWFRFYCKDAPIGVVAYTITGAAGDGRIIHGTQYTSNSSSAYNTSRNTSGTGVSNIAFNTDTATIGDNLYIWSDGTYWYATALCDADLAIIFNNGGA